MNHFAEGGKALVVEKRVVVVVDEHLNSRFVRSRRDNKNEQHESNGLCKNRQREEST